MTSRRDEDDVAGKREQSWQSKLELLQKYQDQNGHCQVPKCYEIDGVKLGFWVSTQKKEYRKHIEGKPALITQDHIKKLEIVGIEWNPYKTQWQLKFELFQNYQQHFGHCQAPR